MSIYNQLIDSKLSAHVIRDVDLANLLQGSPQRRYSLVNRAIKKGELLRLRRGLYLLTAQNSAKLFSKYYLANHILPYSIVSAESALSYHGWIPERVTSVTSTVAYGRDKMFETPYGRFYYKKTAINSRHFLSGVNLIKIDQQPVWMADPLRALLDYIYWHKPPKLNVDFLLESLRIELESLTELQRNDFESVQSLYPNKKVILFLEKLKSELKINN